MSTTNRRECGHDGDPAAYTCGTCRAYASLASLRLTVREYEGDTGDRSHITRTETGMVPTLAIADLPGARGERPGGHSRQGERWEALKADIAANGIRSPIFITVDYGNEPQISEGNNRRDVAVELSLPCVPVEIRYFGHAERQGTVTGKTRRP
jgi:hypothetical protein